MLEGIVSLIILYFIILVLLIIVSKTWTIIFIALTFIFGMFAIFNWLAFPIMLVTTIILIVCAYTKHNEDNIKTKQESEEDKYKEWTQW